MRSVREGFDAIVHAAAEVVEIVVLADNSHVLIYWHVFTVVQLGLGTWPRTEAMCTKLLRVGLSELA